MRIDLKPDRRAPPAWGALIIVICVLAAYSNSFGAAFVFDDVRTITANPALERFWAVTRDGSPASGRPLVHLSLALNHALGGRTPAGYHAVNLALHLAAALTLWGLLRRTLRLPRWEQAAPTRDREVFPALAAAAWGVHPLQTEAVTYVSQRAESLCGLLYLLTVYAFVRSAESSATDTTRRAWAIGSVLVCAMGTAAKEVIVTAPVVVLLFDRVFVAGSLRAAIRARRWLYVGLFATWVPLAWWVAAAGSRGGSAGFGGNVAWWQYALRQGGAILHYLRLTIWPHPLVFDYGTGVTGEAGPAVAAAGLVLAGGLAGIALLRWRPVAGFFVTVFLLLLAPSSSVVPVLTQTMAEHRMYLSLACVVVGGGLLLGCWSRAAARFALAAAVVAGGALTWRRNQDYSTPSTLWRETAQARPSNPRAWYNLGVAELAADRMAEARTAFGRAVELRPAYAEAQAALGQTLAAEGNAAAAVTHLTAAIDAQPAFAAAYLNRGGVWQSLGRPDDAIADYEAALKIEPGATDAHFNLAGLRAARDETDVALSHYDAVLQVQPGFMPARFGRANTLARSGRLPEALAAYEALVRENPHDPRARTNLGNVYLLLGRTAEAVASYEEALRLDPQDAMAQAGLEQTRLMNAEVGR